MDERHRLATDIAKYFLASHREPTREDSRLFEDLQQFALEVLKTVRSRDTVPQAVDQKGARLPGEIRGYWPSESARTLMRLLRRAHSSRLLPRRS